MERLSTATLALVPPSVEMPGYERATVGVGIAHFGVGNFHRAHQAVYCDALLNQGETQWGITGISLRSPVMRDHLDPQNGLYTLATLGDQASYRVIGAIQNLLVAPENPQAVIDLLARDPTQLVTTTITEKGYCLAGGAIDPTHPDMAQDLVSLAAPQTVYGYLAAALIQRSNGKGAPLTVLCCDNLQGGGQRLQEGVRMLLDLHSPETQAWVDRHVAFSASMVDRVTPVTTERLKEAIVQRLGMIDAAPVAAEPFSQWIIEDHFAGKRPPFDLAGALFVDDIAPYERIKLRFLNAGHSMLAALGYLAGDCYVHEALQRPALARFTERALKREVMPVTPVPLNFSAEGYIDQVLERFRNAHLPYAVLQVGTDSSQKIQQRWLPSICAALKRGQETSHQAFALAAWVCFVRKALQNNDLNDPLRDAFALCPSADSRADVHHFLALAGADSVDLFAHTSFIASVEKFHQTIDALGVEAALATVATA